MWRTGFNLHSINSNPNLIENDVIPQEETNNNITNQIENDYNDDTIELVLDNEENMIIENVNHENEIEDNLNENLNLDNENKSKVNLNDSTDGFIDSCLICCEQFTSTSEHRIVSLKCGHIFGKSCVERWLKTCGVDKRCPKCNQKANKRDVRIIYAKNIIATDTSERDQALQELEKEKDLRLHYEQKVEELRLDLNLKESEIAFLKKELIEKEETIKRISTKNIINENLKIDQINSVNKKSCPFKLLEKIDLKINGCRLIAVSEILGFLIISQPTSSSALIQGYGIRKLSLANLKNSEFLFLHEKTIRDISIHYKDAVLLTASLDKSVKLVNLITSSIMGTIKTDCPPWSVTWNNNINNLFYIGLNDGSILECCSISKIITKKILTSLKTPIISLKNLFSSNEKIGFLITSLISAFYGDFINTSNDNLPVTAKMQMKPIPVTGKFFSSSVYNEKNSGYILLSCRPDNTFGKVQHYLVEYEIDMNCEMNYRSTRKFTGGSRSLHLIRTKVFLHPNDLTSVLVCSGDEESMGCFIWEKEVENPIQKIFCGANVLDVSLMKNANSGSLLILLTENKLFLYLWDL